MGSYIDEVLSDTSDLFADHGVLTRQKRIDDMIGRDEEYRRGVGALQRGINGGSLQNICIEGPSGSGKKTLIVKTLNGALRQFIQSKQDGDQITIVPLSGRFKTYSFGLRLINKIQSEEVIQGEYAKESLYGRITRELEQIGGIVIILVEDIDDLEMEPPLHELIRQSTSDGLDQTKLGFISSSVKPVIEMSWPQDIKNILSETHIKIDGYDKETLEKILERHADLAFKDGVIAEDIIEQCASFVADRTGNADQALRFLSSAGTRAEMEGDEVVDQRHMNDVLSAQSLPR